MTPEEDRSDNVVLLRSAVGGPALTFEMSAFRRHDEYIHDYDIRISGDGLTAEVRVIGSEGVGQFDDFVEGLDQSFRGWDGTRLWTSPERQVQVEASWSISRRITLLIRCTPNVISSKWSVSATFVLDPDDLGQFRDAVQQFFAR